MTKQAIIICCFIASALSVSAKDTKTVEIPLYKDANVPTEQRVEDLLSRMTLKEKIGQLLCPLGWPFYEKTTAEVGKGKKKKTQTVLRVSELYKERMADMPLGSVWAIQRADPWTQKTLETGIGARESAEMMNILQKYAIEETRLGIPVMIMEEAPHGHMGIGSTCFPTGIGQAATFDPALMQEMGVVIGNELSLRGAQIAYGPVLDIAREPRWSRVEETYGEDPYLAGILGSSIVKGVRSQGVYSTLKHFAAYGIPEGGLNGEQVSLGWNQLLNEYIPQFRRAVDNGAASIMTSYNGIDGIPCTGNKELLTDMLRGQWGFDGFIISDLQSIEVMRNNLHVVNDYTEAAAMAIKAGVDIDLEGISYKNLGEALDRGLVTMADIDRAVRQVLKTKFELGMFEHPYVDINKVSAVHSDANKDVARRVAQESIVMLKNDGLLPLSKDIKSIAVIGPNADNQYNQLGDYTAPQAEEDIVTVLEGIRNTVPDAEVNYVKGCAVRDTKNTDIAAAVAAAKKSDVTVLVVGGSSARDFKTSYASTGAANVDMNATELSDMECGEGYDRATLDLLGDQLPLMQALIDAKVKLAVVYIEGRPLCMNLANEGANALLTAWYPGEQGGQAIADVLFGDVNPSGRLPISVQRNVGQLPVYYSKRISHNYIDSPAAPLFPFGYGLSYTTFEHSAMSVTKANATDWKVTCTVTNTGKVEGEDVVQLYLEDVTSSVAIPRKQLKGFTRVKLAPGESKTVDFTLGLEELGLYNRQHELVIEPGLFRASISHSSRFDEKTITKEFEVK